MIDWLSTVKVIVVLFAGALCGHLDPCPRHRGLPDGLTRSDNMINDRALFRMDLRNTINGYTPNETYRLRVHTTSRKFQFNDATMFIDAVDRKCGAGRLIIDTDKLHSPKDCPDVVTTQEKTPMGRAHFKWQAPSCGCVHIRVRVHADMRYYLENTTVYNGPLARTVCPSADYSPKRDVMKTEAVTEKPLHNKHLSREERLSMLCKENKKHSSEETIKNKQFTSQRHVTVANSFDRERLNIALDQRKANTEECCMKDRHEVLQCFGDVRRRRIDTFCGIGEPNIPFSKTRLDWVKEKETECCWQIGEDRYSCFNYTLHQQTMLKDARMDASHTHLHDMDDFDPANDIADFHSDEDILKKTRSPTTHERVHKMKNTKHKAARIDTTTDNGRQASENDEALARGHSENGHGRAKQIEPLKKAYNDGVDEDRKPKGKQRVVDLESESEESDDEDDDNGNEYDKGNDNADKGDNALENEGEDADDEIDVDDDNEDSDEDVTKIFTDDCCFNGITTGTLVVDKGFEGCFEEADKLHKQYSNWSRSCDRRFVICCMKVVEGVIFSRHWIPRHRLKYNNANYRETQNIILKKLTRTLNTKYITNVNDLKSNDRLTHIKQSYDVLVKQKHNIQNKNNSINKSDVRTSTRNKKKYERLFNKLSFYKT